MATLSFADQLSAITVPFTLRAADSTHLKEVAEWLSSEGIPAAKTEMAGILGKKRFPMMKACDAVRQGLATTANEQSQCLKRQQYYHANMVMFVEEAARYCRVISSATLDSSAPFCNATTKELHEGLGSLLLGLQAFFEQSAHFLLDCPGVYNAWSKQRAMPFEIFKAAEQTAYGRYSILTHMDRAAFGAVASIRVAIETRLRRAFGVFSFWDPSCNRAEPISVSRLLEAIETTCPNAAFDVDRHDVAKIYRWSNFYLHAGWVDFPWTSGYVIQYVRPLFSGKNRPDGSWSIHNGITVPRAEWEALQVRFELDGKARGLVFGKLDPSDAECDIC